MASAMSWAGSSRSASCRIANFTDSCFSAKSRCGRMESVAGAIALGIAIRSAISSTPGTGLIRAGLSSSGMRNGIFDSKNSYLTIDHLEKSVGSHVFLYFRLSEEDFLYADVQWHQQRTTPAGDVTSSGP